MSDDNFNLIVVRIKEEVDRTASLVGGDFLDTVLDVVFTYLSKPAANNLSKKYTIEHILNMLRIYDIDEYEYAEFYHALDKLIDNISAKLASVGFFELSASDYTYAGRQSKYRFLLRKRTA